MDTTIEYTSPQKTDWKDTYGITILVAVVGVKEKPIYNKF